MKRYLVRTIRHNKAGKRIGKYTPIYAKNRKEAAMKHAMKDTFAVGAGSMIGAGALGSMASMSGVPAGLGSNIMGAAGVGFTALNYGQALKNVTSTMQSSFKLKAIKRRKR
jgi:hypothetical protein